jgi:hypothetical protein
VSAGIVVALIALLGAAPPSPALPAPALPAPAPVDALLAGIDSPPPSRGTALSVDERAALRAVAFDATQAVLRRARALRLFAEAAAVDEVVVDDDLAALQAGVTGELRVQAAWARVDRAARAGRVLTLAVALLAHEDAALRAVGALAAWREGSPAARRAMAARLTVERDDDVTTLLRARLARWRRGPSSLAPPSSRAPGPQPPGLVR